MGKFTIYTGKDDQFRFNLKAGNGEKVLQSEGYKSKAGCQNGVASVQKNAAEEGRFEQRESSNGKHYFVLKAGNGEIIGTSEMYESQQACQNGIGAVQRAAGDASVVEE